MLHCSSAASTEAAVNSMTCQNNGRQLLFSALLLSSFSLINAANILAIFPLTSPSHHIWNSPLVVALAQRGHNVTVLSSTAQETPVQNLTDFVVPELWEDVHETNFEEMVDAHPLAIVDSFLAFLSHSCKTILKSDTWKQLINYTPESKFDLVIIEAMGAECLLGIHDRFGKPPIVVVNAFNVPQWMLDMTGSPNVISYMPHQMLAATDQMTFLERIQNLYYYVYTYYQYYYHYLPEMEKLAQEFYGNEILSFYKVRESISLGLANFHPALDHPYARTPNLIHVAGIQIREPKPLPKDLQKFLDDADNGAIFFSFGSNVQCNKLPTQKINAFLQAFADVPQRILWKYEDDSLPEKPQNVKIGKWLPQSDILAHPNIKVFITHSGLLSTHEAIYRGVPIIGIPIFAEQSINIQKMRNLGTGIRLNYRDLTKETILKTLRTVLEDTSYRKNMQAFSARFRDDPQTPLERAVFWTEYVLRHKGAPQLQSAAKDLNFVKYYLLDVIAFLITVPVLLSIILYSLCCKRKPIEKSKSKKN